MRNCSQRVSWLVAGLAISLIATASGNETIENQETVTETKKIAVETVYMTSRTTGAGRIVKKQDGKPGEVTRTYKVVKKDGKIVSKTLLKEDRVEMQPEVYFMGKSGWQTSRGSFNRKKTLLMNASAYDTGSHSNGKWAGTTRLGIPTQFGVVAVDPRVIPLGSLLFVEGYGFAYAADTGSAIKGNRIDLCMESVAACYKFGRRKVTVHVLSAR